jgi:hypothetical protein
VNPRLARVASARGVVVLAALLALALTLPSLAGGLAQDDWLQRLAVRPDPRVPVDAAAPWDLFVFERGDLAGQRRRMDDGARPWWMVPGLRVAFLRPLSSLTHYLDYRLAPRLPALAHLHSLAWFALAVAAVARLYRRVAGPTALAGAAALLYAVDDAHGLAVGWLANRNALIATLAGALCLHAHDRWRREGWRPGAALAPALFAAGLLAGEAALGALGYLAAHALFLDPGRGWRRALPLAPYLALVAGWRALYHALGYGAYGSGFYIDPAREPAEFVRALFSRFPALLVGLFGLPPSELVLAIPGAARVALLSVGLGLLAWIAAGLRPLLRDPLMRFWALGCALSVVPMCATWPNDRLLFFPGIGAMALVAALISRGTGRAPSGRALAVVLVVIHAVLAPLLLPVRSLSFRLLFGGMQERAAATLPSDEAVTRQRLVVVNAPSFTAPVMGIALRGLSGGRVPRRSLVLSAGIGRVAVTRVDERTVELRPEGGFLTDPISIALRGPGFPYRAGERVTLTGLDVTVGAVTPDGRPLAARFRFDRALEDGALRWVVWGAGGFEPFALPAPGATVTVPAIDPMALARGASRAALAPEQLGEQHLPVAPRVEALPPHRGLGVVEARQQHVLGARPHQVLQVELPVVGAAGPHLPEPLVEGVEPGGGRGRPGRGLDEPPRRRCGVDAGEQRGEALGGELHPPGAGPDEVEAPALQRLREAPVGAGEGLLVPPEEEALQHARRAPGRLREQHAGAARGERGRVGERPERLEAALGVAA